MDSYDLFGEDVSGSMLDGLADLGSNNYDPAAASRAGGDYQQQSQQQPPPTQPQAQQHAYPPGDAAAAAAMQKQQSAYLQQHPSMQKQPYPHMPQDPLPKQSAAYPHMQQQQTQAQQQESPLQKLASFGGDFSASSNHMDPSSQAMFHQNHSGYGDTARPIHPSSAASSMSGGYVRSMAPQSQPPGQYGYNSMENMYSMDQSMGMGDSSSMQGWGTNPNYRQQPQHYSQIAQGTYRQPHMNYQDPSAMAKQYPSQQGMMGSMMQPHQGLPPSANYNLPQQPQRMPHHQAPQQQAQQQQQASQQPQQPQQQQQQQYHASNSQSMSYPGPNAGYSTYGPMQRMPHHVQYPSSQSQMQLPDQSQSYGQGFAGFGQPQPPTQPTQQTQAQPQQHQAPSQGQPPQSAQASSQSQAAQQSQSQQQSNQSTSQQPLIRPIGVDVGSAAQYATGQKGPQSGIGGASPQYRAPFPQLSPQMSPRPQPQQQPTQQMSPRPVMSPAKPSTLSPHPHVTLSPRPKSATPTPSQSSFPSQQSTLQQLEQMVMPQVSSGTDYPNYGPRGQLGQPQSSPIGPRTPVSPQWPQQTNRPPFGMNGSLGLMDSQSGSASQQTSVSAGADTSGASASQSDYNSTPGAPGSSATASDKEGTKAGSLVELNGPQSQASSDPTNTASSSGPDASSMMGHGNMSQSYPPGYSSYMGPSGMPYGSKPGDLHGSTHGYPAMSLGPGGPPGSIDSMHGGLYGAPGQAQPQQPQALGMMQGDYPFQGPVSHQQEMAALQQQIQELYCMPPGPDHHEKISQLQGRLAMLQRHEVSDRCNGGPQCMLQSSMYGYNSMENQYPPPTPSGRGKGRAKSSTPRAKKPRGKKAQQEQLLQQQMEEASYNMSQAQDLNSPPFHPAMPPHLQQQMGQPSLMGGMPPHMPPHLSGHLPPHIPPHHMSAPPPQPAPQPAPGQTPSGSHMGGLMSPHMPGPPPQQSSQPPLMPPMVHGPSMPPQQPIQPPPPQPQPQPHPQQPQPQPPAQPPQQSVPSLSSPIPSLQPQTLQPPASHPPTPLPPPPAMPDTTHQAQPATLPLQLPADSAIIEPLSNSQPDSGLQSPESQLEKSVGDVKSDELSPASVGPPSDPKLESSMDSLPQLHSQEMDPLQQQVSSQAPPNLQSSLYSGTGSSESPEVSGAMGLSSSNALSLGSQPASHESGEVPLSSVGPMGPLLGPEGMPFPESPTGELDDKKKGSRKARSRKPKEPKEAKEPKTPKPLKEKVPKEPKAPKVPKTPKEPRTSKDKKRKESKTPGEGKIPRKRTPKKKNEEDTDQDLQTSVDGENSSLQMPQDESSDGTLVIATDGDTTLDSTAEGSPQKSKSRVRKPKGVLAVKGKKSSSSRRKKRKKEYEKDDDEVDDVLLTTPPASPEDDAEGSVLKRRSARNTHRKKYVDDDMLRFSDDDAQNSKPAEPKPVDAAKVEKPEPAEVPVKPNYVYVNTGEEDTMVVQQILAVRKGRREVKPEVGVKEEEKKEEEKKEEEKEVEEEKEEEIKEESEVKEEKEEGLSSSCEGAETKSSDIVEKENESQNSEACDNESATKDSATDPVTCGSDPVKEEIKKEVEKKEWVEVDEFYVKYRNFSYLHCEWKTEEELLKGDKRIQGKIKRFMQKMAHLTNIFENLEEDPFNPDYVEVDRVLDVSEQADPNTGQSAKHYLVKWRSLQYEDCTWELEEDIDPLKIQEFERFRKLPPRDQWKPKKRPSAEDWCKLDNSPVFKNGNTLREYQLEGLNWLLFSWYNGRNCILADEMGLGKTIQSLTFVNSVHDYGIRGPFLVIAPLSTIPNWQREFEAWTDLNVIVYHGSAASRNMLMEYELYFRNDKGTVIKDMAKFNVLITTFEMIITDVAELKTFNWRLCVIDEAHRLKNRNCKLLEGLRSLKLEHRVLLSGTPLQNNVNELFSLLNFLEPTQFTSSEAFLQDFGALKTETEVQKLQVVLKPMMLRRLKEDVEKSIAPKEETVVEVELTNIQKKYYRGILERNFSFLAKGTTSNNVPNLMNTMMELRKCCIHPYLLNGAEDQIQYDFKNAHGEDPDAYYKALINSSGKMVLIDKLLPKLKSNGHRVLIFSQMVRCLDILEDYLMYRKYQFERIDGRIRGNLRQAAIDRFCKPDSDRFVFLLCTKAGGQGINLTAADTVIIFDSDWNPQNDLQAQARCHRIGQQKMVKVYRLLCRNTYEREMFDKASLKLGLDKAILQSMNTSQGKDVGGSKQLTKKEIEDLLKKGAYGAIMDEDNAGDKFCEEDIDQILERRTQIITLESEKGSTFSKASFACSTARQDINIDDPDFWKKWAKKADIDTTERGEEENLVISEPRRRTQIKRYGHDESTLNMSDLESSNSDSDEEGEEEGIGRRGRKSNKLSKKRRRPDDYIPREGEIVYGSWDRTECFKVERGLLTFGWGRWQDCLSLSQFRKGWTERAYEDCARVILLYCLRFYRGDEKIRAFIWDLITPSENGEAVSHKNHLGLSSPVPRGGRKPKKIKSKDGRFLGQNNLDKDHWSHSEKYDGDIYLEPTYKKHLLRHANKVLLRVRMLYYIKHEVLAEVLDQINDNVPVSSLAVYPPPCELLPVHWWDTDADRSLLVGTYKHGYESYPLMRNDPALGFLARLGPLDPGSAMLADSNSVRDEDKLSDDEEEGVDRRRLRGVLKTPEDADESKDANGSEASNTAKSDDGESKPNSAAPQSPGSESQPSGSRDEETKQPQSNSDLEWPSAVDLNTRLRRVITAYQRNFKKQELMQMQKAKRGVEGEQHAVLRDALNTQGVDFQQLAMYLWKMERREKIEQIVRERERQRLDCSQRKWSRREEADFLRAVSMFGVEYDRKTGQYDWSKFRTMAHLEKKYDDTMTEYYRGFCAMLKRACGVKLTPEEELSDMIVEPLTEERARKVLDRMELMSKIREEILFHPKLEDRLKLCKTSADLPEWWIPGRHDRDLLLGVAKHGLVRTEYYILNDPDLSFQKIVKRLLMGESIHPSKMKRETESDNKAGMKLEHPEDILKMDKGEILVKLEKGEGTLRIEKVGIKTETDSLQVKVEKDDVKLSVVKSEPTEEPENQKKTDEPEESELKVKGSSMLEEASKEEPTLAVKEQDVDSSSTSKSDLLADSSKTEDMEKVELGEEEEKIESSQENSLSKSKVVPENPTETVEVTPMEVDTNDYKPDGQAVKQDDIESSEESAVKIENEVPSKETSSSAPSTVEDTNESSKIMDQKDEVCEDEKRDITDPSTINPEDEAKQDNGQKGADREIKTDEQLAEDPSQKDSNVDKPEDDSIIVDKPVKESDQGSDDTSTKDNKDACKVEEGMVKVDRSSEQPSESKEKDVSGDTESKDSKEKSCPSKISDISDNADVKIEKEVRGKMKSSDLQALFPDLEVVHPLSRLSEIDTIVVQDQKSSSQSSYGQHSYNQPSYGSQSSMYGQSSFASNQAQSLQALQGMSSMQALQHLQSMERLDPAVSQLLAQSFHAQIKWPKDMAVEARLQHIVHCVEKGEWPVSRNFSVFSSLPQLPVVLPPGVTATIPNSHGSNVEVDLSYMDSVNDRRDGASTPYSDSSDVITITTDNGSLSSQYPQFMRKRKRHIAIDVETERAKLHALLNSTNSASQHQSSHMAYRSDRDRYDRDRADRQLERQQLERQQLERQQMERQQMERQQMERRQYKELERHQLLERQQQLERAAQQLLDKTDRRQPTPQPKQSPLTWDDESASEDSRRSTPVQQPPPAHQQGPRVLSMPYDLGKFTMPSSKPKQTPVPVASPSPSPSMSSGAIDLSGGPPKSKTPSEDSFGMGGEDEAQDFSMGKKRKSSKLDDMLGKLMQKKNVPLPAEEPMQGKGMKRRKLDEIVMGLSAAKEQQSYPDPMPKRRSPTPMIPPGVTVTPASSASRTPTPTHSSSGSSSKPPFSITVTSVPHPPPPSTPSSSRNPSSSSASSTNLSKDTYSSYLAQAEQHNLLLKQHQLQQQILQQQQLLKTATSSSTQRKTYEAMLADINKAAELTSKINSYSHEAKVNKWLSEQTSLLPDAGLGADYLPRRRRPRVDPTLLDWKKLTGEENVSVINRMTGKKLTGNKAPPLKRLAAWLLENPMFDVDPKWAELVKERGNLPHDLQKRLPPGERKKPGRPPLMSSPTGQTSSSASQAMNFQGLGSLNPSLLSSMSQNNPFLLPFGNLPNMNAALGGMSGLGNLNNLGLSSSLFANLASLGLPGLSGMDAAALGELLASAGGATMPTASTSTAASSASSKHKAQDDKAGSSEKDRDRRDADRSRDQDRRDRDRSSSLPSSSGSSAAVSSSTTTTSSSTSKTTPSSALPFMFPNPGLLYSPLGLSGLNPFYDSLAQQVGLLNGSLASTAPTSSSSSLARGSSSSTKTPSSSSSGRTPIPSASTVAANNRHQREALERQQQQLQQFLLPQDTKLLESLSSKSRHSVDSTRVDDRGARRSKAEADNLRHLMAGIPPAYTASDDRSKRTREALERESMLNYVTESMLRSDPRMREALESMGRSSVSGSKELSSGMREREIREAMMKTALESLAHTTSTRSASLSSSSHDTSAKSREALMKEAMDKYGHVPTDLIIRSSERNTSSSDRTSDRSGDGSSKRPRDLVVKEALESLGQSLASGALAKQSREAIQMASLLGASSWDLVMRGTDKKKSTSDVPMELVSPSKTESRFSSGEKSREERLEKDDRLRDRPKKDEKSWAEEKSRREDGGSKNLEERVRISDKGKPRLSDVQDLSKGEGSDSNVVSGNSAAESLVSCTSDSKSSKGKDAVGDSLSGAPVDDQWASNATVDRSLKRGRDTLDDNVTGEGLSGIDLPSASKKSKDEAPSDQVVDNPSSPRREIEDLKSRDHRDSRGVKEAEETKDIVRESSSVHMDSEEAVGKQPDALSPTHGREDGESLPPLEDDQMKGSRGRRRGGSGSSSSGSGGAQSRNRSRPSQEDDTPVERKVLRSSAGRAAAAAAARAAREQAARSREESESDEA